MGIKLTFYGHACFGAEINGKHLLFDPFISPNELAKHININEIAADYIFISHGHEDHIADAVAIAKRTGATVIANYEIVQWLAAQGVENGHPMNIGGQWTFDFGSIKMVNAVHSSVLPDGTYGGNPGGFVLTTDQGNFYYAGDTALNMDMQLIGQQHQLDFALLPIGDNFTMGIEDAINCAQFINCQKIVGMHFDTFGYIKINKEETLEQFNNKGLTLELLEIGNSITL
jgi:L-ascorbate metabolism protein UlaG (beta-lactamase superfamily)